MQTSSTSLPERNTTASITFDAGYIEPALLTAYELITTGLFQRVFLLFLDGTSVGRGSEALYTILRDFEARFHDDCTVIVFQNFLPNFKFAHFNQSIIAKLFAPKIINKVKGLHFNFDAGIFLGNKFRLFVESSESIALSSRLAIYAHKQQQRTCDVHPELAPHLDNRPYLAGGVFLFDCETFIKDDLPFRFVSAINRSAGKLMYADQELVLLSLSDDECGDLPFGQERVTRALAAQLQDWRSWSYADLNNSIFNKVIGTLKPWKLWVLDPNKRFFLRKSRDFASILDLGIYPAVQEARMSGYEKWLAFNLAEYSKFLECYEDTAPDGKMYGPR